VSESSGEGMGELQAAAGDEDDGRVRSASHSHLAAVDGSLGGSAA